MPEHDTPIEDLIESLTKSNDDYHEGIDAIMKSTNINVELKTRILANAKAIFDGMRIINESLAELQA